MRSDVKRAWIEKLRRGIPQIRGKLGIGDARCALGVLCDVAVEQGVTTKEIKPESGTVVYGGEGVHAIPLHIQQWANLRQEDITLVETLNDRGDSFETIAGFIDKYL
jgi:hypothetical protein